MPYETWWPNDHGWLQALITKLRRAGKGSCAMCLGIPGQVIEVLADYDDQLALVDVQGARRHINLGLLEPDQEALSPGEWVLIHMGFALERIDEAEAKEALAALELMGGLAP